MSNLNKKEFKTDFAGQTLSLTVSRLAEQATSAILGQHGDTSVLVTATMGKEDRSIDYFPLVVDYEEKFYAAGKIIGSRFIRREGRPSDEAILSSRLIDRSLRPLFDERLRRDVQIVITVLSYDEENDPDFIALLTASTALAASEIPWAGPVAGVRLGLTQNGELVLNPKNSHVNQLKESSGLSFEAFVAGTKDKINMIELAGFEAQESAIAQSFGEAHKAIQELIGFQEGVIKSIAKPKIQYRFPEEDAALQNKISEFVKGKLEEAVCAKDKIEHQKKLDELKEEIKKYLSKEGTVDALKVGRFLDEEVGKLVKKNILEKNTRPDGRKLDEVRELYGEVGLFKRLHGSALFTRGNTQALAVATLAAPGAEQMFETMEASGKRRFMLHYNFPPYSVGEIGRLGAPGRREIGHGALAEKALAPLIPSKEDFPYTIRVVSEILSSNGSSSMATACAASLALMDAGVPIKKPAAGIAMGLISDESRYKILTDLQGLEDHHGDMDFKVAGTTDGVTAMQIDVKINGITTEILSEALTQAKKARLQILDFMKGVLAEPRKQVSEYAPIIMALDIRPDQIGEVIGPGGKIINSIIAQTGVASIDIDQSGKVFVAGADHEKTDAAIQYIKSLTRDFQVGEIIQGKVIKLLDFGAIVDLGGGKDGMIHVSEMREGFVKKPDDVVKIGDTVRAKVIRTENGRVALSLKALAGQSNPQ